MLTPDQPGFVSSARDGLFNQMRPDRLPAVIARVADDDDVRAALALARDQGLQVVVRGGGHNWCCPSLRNGGMLMDLSNLTRVLSVDAERRRAVVEAVVSNREVMAALRPHGLGYPVGHCPTVKMSGYLLGGGMAWNHGVWGPGVGSVEAIDVMLADGQLVTASRDDNSDLFWAARGAGPGFFAVALRYHLKLYPLPRAIASSAYYFRMTEVRRIAEWLGPLADTLDPCVELSLFMQGAPPALADACGDAHGKVCAVTASVFADTAEEAARAARPLETNPRMDVCLSRTFSDPVSFEQLFDVSGSLWPDGLRCRVDAAFSNASLAAVIDATSDHFLEAPSPETILMYAVFTGGAAPPTPSDAAFSSTGRLYGGPWTMWRSADHDAVNQAWHERCMTLLAPLTHTRYITESNTVSHPEFVEAALGAERLTRMEGLLKRYDPDGLFFGFQAGLS